MKFRLDVNKQLSWPNRCAYCGSKATATHTVHGKTYSGYAFKILWHEFKYNKLGVTFPVCNKHKYISIFLPPVGVMDVGEHYYTLIIKNPIYGAEFSHLNNCQEYLK